MSANDTLPYFLQSFENLVAHFDEHFGELGSNARGDTFLGLAQKLIPLTQECQGFPRPEPSETKSHDDGVDLLTSETDNGRILCVQSKYKIRDKDSVDSIISKFKNFEAGLRPKESEPELFEKPSKQPSVPVPTFVVITSSKLEGIVSRYESSTLASRGFYEQLKQQARLIVIDGPRILSLLQQLYRKAHQLPANVTLKSAFGWVHVNGVHLGAIRGLDLVALYEEHGDALFFENIRDFLGTTSGKVVATRSTVNQEIIQTISVEPIKMLPRNNGVTFRAKSVVLADAESITITNAAIVNGCQTTMCLVHCYPVPADCVVQVKVVETDDAWDIAKAANYQNQVARVDLDLARYLRPQLVRKVATELGYAIESESTVTASSVLDTIYRNRVNYEELRLLYLGLFSRKPNNLFEGNYTELRADVLANLYENYEKELSEEAIFAVLLLLLKESRAALDECRATFSGAEYSSLFKRFHQDDKPRYRAYLAIAALCGLLRDDLSDKSSDATKEAERISRFLAKARKQLENEPGEFRNVFLMTFQTLADSLLDVPGDRTESEIAQQMSAKVSGMAFSAFYKRVLLRIDGERSRLAKQEPADAPQNRD